MSEQNRPNRTQIEKEVYSIQWKIKDLNGLVEKGLKFQERITKALEAIASRLAPKAMEKQAEKDQQEEIPF